jgi:hypothetical protein
LVRARKEGGAGWNATESKRFVRTYGEQTGEDIREGFDPADEFTVGEDDEEPEESEESRQWKQSKEPELRLKPKYGLDGEEAFENVWTGGEPSQPPQENP